MSQLTPAQLKKMTVAQLQEVLEEKGLKKTGKKAELIERLEEAQKQEAAGTTGAAAKADAAAEAKPAAKDKVEAKAGEAKRPAAVAAPAAAPAPSTAVAQPDAASAAPVANGDSEKNDAPKILSLSKPKEDLVTAKQHRAEKFGVDLKLSEDEKRAKRTSRFGVDTTATLATGGNRKRKAGSSAEDLAKLAERAKKFGLPVSAQPASANTDTALKRAKKFGTPIPSGVVDPAESKKREARSKRFAAAGTNAASAAAAGQPKAVSSPPAPPAAPAVAPTATAAS